MQLAVEPGARLSRHLADVREIGFGSHLAAAFLDLLEQERQRLVEELDGLEHGVGEALLEGLRPGEHAVLAEGILDDELHGLLGAYELGDELRPAPAGDEPEEDLGAGEVAHGRRDRPVVAVERDLDAASERRAVDRRRA